MAYSNVLLGLRITSKSAQEYSVPETLLHVPALKYRPSCVSVQFLLSVGIFFFLAQFQQHNLPKYLNLHKQCFVLAHFLFSYTTELLCTSLMSSVQQPLRSVSCSFSSLSSFPILPADISAQALSPGFTVALHTCSMTLSNIFPGEFEQNKS